MNKALPDNIYCLCGAAGVQGNHAAFHLTSSDVKQEDRLRGIRADWIIFFDEPTIEETNMKWKPMLKSSYPRFDPVMLYIPDVKPLDEVVSIERLRAENLRLKTELDHYRSILDT